MSNKFKVGMKVKVRGRVGTITEIVHTSIGTRYLVVNRQGWESGFGKEELKLVKKRRSA